MEIILYDGKPILVVGEGNERYAVSYGLYDNTQEECLAAAHLISNEHGIIVKTKFIVDGYATIFTVTPNSDSQDSQLLYGATPTGKSLNAILQMALFIDELLVDAVQDKNLAKTAHFSAKEKCEHAGLISEFVQAAQIFAENQSNIFNRIKAGVESERETLRNGGADRV